MPSSLVSSVARQSIRLWYQLTQALKKSHPTLQQGTVFHDLFTQFLHSHADKLAPIDYAAFAITAARQQKDKAKQLAFLEKVHSELKHTRTQATIKDEESGSAPRPSRGGAPKKLQSAMSKSELEPALLLLHLEITRVLLAAGQIDSAVVRDRLAQDKAEIDANQRSGMQKEIYTCYYRTASDYHKQKGTPSQYYENALLYLQYTPMETLPAEEQAALAQDIATSALLGKDVYNFGELLQRKEIVQQLKSNPASSYLAKLLEIFNAGQLTRFNLEFINLTQGQPLLSLQRAFLLQKLRIMALIDHVHKSQSQSRTMEFKQIQKVAQLESINDVEHLLLKALAVGAMRGTIDECAQQATINWVQPSVLNMEQVAQLQKRLAQWSVKIEKAQQFVSSQGKDLLA